jgi:prepilin signal peptidase PulO-like enzyme (type II secretory pathway)
MKIKLPVLLLGAFILTSILFPETGLCSVESTLNTIQSKLINVFLPLAGILGLCFSAFSFFSGNPGARQHLWLAILGACIGFGAPEIITLIRSVVN